MSDADKTRGRAGDAQAAHDGSDSDETVIQIDGFRIKTKVRPNALKEDKPKTWKEVWASIDASLKGIVAGVFDLGYEVVHATRTVVRGLASIPQAVADRIEAGHAEADDIEGRSQADGSDLLTPEQAMERFMDVVHEMEAEGIPVTMRCLPNGRWVITAARPDAHRLGHHGVQGALPDRSDEPSGE